MPPVIIVTDVIAFIVSVPVLSLLITVVPPSVSTSVSDFTTALDSARRWAPDDSISCTKVGNPVGMAEIAVETHSRISVSDSWPRAMPTRAMMATAPQARTPKIFVRSSSSTCSGDLVRFVAVTMSAIWPICVALARRDDHHLGRPASHLGVLEHEVGPVAEWHVGFGDCHGVLGDRCALAGQRRLLHLQRCRRHDPSIGGHEIAGLHEDDVAGHQSARIDLDDRSVTTDPCHRHLELGERIDARQRLALLIGPHHHVEGHEQADDEAGADLADREARHRNDEQHDVHRIGDLALGHFPEGRRRLGRHLVAAVLGESMLDLGVGEPGGGIDLESQGGVGR